MFAKLLKHEWRATWGVLGLLCAIILGCGVSLGGLYLYLAVVEGQTSTAAEVFCAAFAALAVIAVIVCCAGGILYLIWRFYKRCFTDEGYLTFTLPVSSHQILLSSIVNAIFGSVVIFLAGCAAVFLALSLMLGGMLMLERDQIIWADAVQSFGTVWEALTESLAENWQNLLMFLGSGAANWVAELTVIMLAVSVGCLLAKKHKFLLGVGTYYGIQAVLGSLALQVPLLATQSGIRMEFGEFMGYFFVRGLGVAVVCYFAMYFLIHKKLNLN